ncbi:hypothetical protein E3P99_03698 [Wallemia hederae]|uniref:Uncharacterized protein n=1 Tax=Wallemia hederae TaxID=1540922 RepID=A0A4T0FDV5_9BASI|nr:hypothetical protein E3P99_03698 [Wallemia hederae]
MNMKSSVSESRIMYVLVVDSKTKIRADDCQIKTKHLKGLKIDFNSSDSVLGSVNAKGSQLSVHSQSKSNSGESTSKFESASIKDELDQFQLLLPTGDGKMVAVNKPIAHRLQLSNSIPTLKAPKFEKHMSSDGALKREQPTDKLKWRFRPPGFDTDGPEGTISTVAAQSKPKKEKKEKKDKKDKKRKSIDESPVKEEKKKKHKRSDSSKH